jgi:hypothetical protein
MAEIFRPRFGRPCFNFPACSANVPEPRVRELRERAEAQGRRFRVSDVLCVRCGRDADLAMMGVETFRR